MKKWFKKLLFRFIGWAKQRFEQFLVDENEKQFRKIERQLGTRRKAALLTEQNNCDHVAGCSLLGEMRDPRGRTSIAWHTSDLGIEFGICLVCQRQFWPSDPDYAFWRKQPCMNRPSRAGSRLFFDPQAVVDNFLRDEVRPFELDPNPRKISKFSGPEPPTDSAKPPEGVVKELNSLSDLEIGNLWKRLRSYRQDGKWVPSALTPPPLARICPSMDPWFLNKDGSPDEFAEANVDFSMEAKDLEALNEPA